MIDLESIQVGQYLTKHVKVCLTDEVIQLGNNYQPILVLRTTLWFVIQLRLREMAQSFKGYFMQN